MSAPRGPVACGADALQSMRGGATNEAHVEYLAATLDQKLDGYEAILSKQKYLAGDVSRLCPAVGDVVLTVPVGDHPRGPLPLAVRRVPQEARLQLPRGLREEAQRCQVRVALKSCHTGC